MSAAVASVAQEADVAEPIRPALAKAGLIDTPTDPREAKSGESSGVDNGPKYSGTKESDPAPHHVNRIVPKAGAYADLDDVREKFQKKAQEKGVKIVGAKTNHADENGEDSQIEDAEDSQSEDEESKAKDKRQREEMLRNGGLNQRFQGRPTDLPPDEICRMYTQFLPTVRNWWIHDQEEAHYQKMEKINQTIRDANRKAKRDEDKFLFPYKMISDYVSGARLILQRIRRLDEGPERTAEAKKMLAGQTVFSEKLMELRVDFKRLVSQEIRDELDGIYSKPELEKQRTELNNLFRKPTLKQRAILEPALELLSRYYDFLGEGDDTSMDNIITELDGINKRLKESNLNEGLQENDHILPIDHLRAINVVVDGEVMMSTEEKDDVIRTNSKQFEASLQCFGVSDASIPKKYTEGIALPEEELRQMQQDAANFEGPEPQESTGSDARADGKKNQQEGQRMEQHQGEKHHGYQNAGNSPPKLMSLPQTKPLINKGIDEGITDCGKVLSVTKAGFGHRVFTNIGTDVVPVYKMFPGSSFPKSARDDLCNRFASEPQPEGMKDSHIEILDTVVHPVKNGNYTWVVYKWTAEMNPKPRIMSHSDLARRLGRKPALRQERNGFDARKKRLEILRLMRESPDVAIAEGVPPFNECPPYMTDGLVDEEDSNEEDGA
ncbi:hypothetical protein DBV05_g12763 [Lasiodiplodia theobromae]|uniref:Uncharacterized protein n=1 Tax=Lasiodiplodia theobromae TaxID=45133 RepID=A0A5N5CT91_9PEZI|nr:hypothetical protein DBV05_g12763 [Lasiodiplodia theobromae]